MLIISVKDKILPSLVLVENVSGLLHTVCQQESLYRLGRLLVRQALPAQHRFHQRLCPHFGFVLPFH